VARTLKRADLTGANLSGLATSGRIGHFPVAPWCGTNLRLTGLTTPSGMQHMITVTYVSADGLPAGAGYRIEGPLLGGAWRRTSLSVGQEDAHAGSAIETYHGGWSDSKKLSRPRPFVGYGKS
jgi:hypothetical protein